MCHRRPQALVMCFPRTTVSVALGSEMRRSMLRESSGSCLMRRDSPIFCRSGLFPHPRALTETSDGGAASAVFFRVCARPWPPGHVSSRQERMKSSSTKNIHAKRSHYYLSSKRRRGGSLWPIEGPQWTRPSYDNFGEAAGLSSTPSSTLYVIEPIYFTS